MNQNAIIQYIYNLIVLPSITFVNVAPSVLTPGESQVHVEAEVSDPMGVTHVSALAYDAQYGLWTSEMISLTLATGDSLSGTYGEKIVFPASVMDGQYVILVLASNAESIEGDWDTLATNYDGVVSLERGVTSSDTTPPEITSVSVDPPVLTAGQFEATVTVTVTDDLGVISMAGVVINRETLLPVSNWNDFGFGLIDGTPQDGTWNGNVSIPEGNEDGDHYRIAIRATDVAGNYAENQDLPINVQRGTELPPLPTPDVPTPDTSEKGKCCCEISVNITAGPVNIYVCRSDTKSDIPT